MTALDRAGYLHHSIVFLPLLGISWDRVQVEGRRNRVTSWRAKYMEGGSGLPGSNKLRFWLFRIILAGRKGMAVSSRVQTGS